MLGQREDLAARDGEVLAADRPAPSVAAVSAYGLAYSRPGRRAPRLSAISIWSPSATAPWRFECEVTHASDALSCASSPSDPSGQRTSRAPGLASTYSPTSRPLPAASTDV